MQKRVVPKDNPFCMLLAVGHLLGSLGSLDGLDQQGNDLEQVANDTVPFQTTSFKIRSL